MSDSKVKVPTSPSNLEGIAIEAYILKWQNWLELSNSSSKRIALATVCQNPWHQSTFLHNVCVLYLHSSFYTHVCYLPWRLLSMWSSFLKKKKSKSKCVFSQILMDNSANILALSELFIWKYWFMITLCAILLQTSS